MLEVREGLLSGFSLMPFNRAEEILEELGWILEPTP